LKIAHAVHHASVYHNETTFAATIDAFSGLLVRPKTSAVGAPLKELTALPWPPSWWKGLAAQSSRNPRSCRGQIPGYAAALQRTHDKVEKSKYKRSLARQEQSS